MCVCVCVCERERERETETERQRQTQKEPERDRERLYQQKRDLTKVCGLSLPSVWLAPFGIAGVLKHRPSRGTMTRVAELLLHGRRIRRWSSKGCQRPWVPTLQEQLLDNFVLKTRQPLEMHLLTSSPQNKKRTGELKQSIGVWRSCKLAASKVIMNI